MVARTQIALEHHKGIGVPKIGSLTCSSNLEYFSVSCLNISHGGILAFASFAAWKKRNINEWMN